MYEYLYTMYRYTDVHLKESHFPFTGAAKTHKYPISKTTFHTIQVKILFSKAFCKVNFLEEPGCRKLVALGVPENSIFS